MVSLCENHRLSFLALILLAASASGDGSLRFNVPSYLNKAYSGSTGMAHQAALFGSPAYGGSIRERLFYATPGKDETGCTTYPRHSDWSKNNTRQFVLLVDRGDCTFVQKVRYAESIGASAVIIADNVCLRSDPDVTCPEANHPIPSGCAASGTACTCPAPFASATPTSLDCGRYYESVEPYMADDGSGGNIDIPSFLVSRYDSQVLKNALAEDGGSSVIVEMTWSIPKQASGELTSRCKLRVRPRSFPWPQVSSGAVGGAGAAEGGVDNGMAQGGFS